MIIEEKELDIENDPCIIMTINTLIRANIINEKKVEDSIDLIEKFLEVKKIEFVKKDQEGLCNRILYLFDLREVLAAYRSRLEFDAKNLIMDLGRLKLTSILLDEVDAFAEKLKGIINKVNEIASLSLKQREPTDDVKFMKRVFDLFELDGLKSNDLYYTIQDESLHYPIYVCSQLEIEKLARMAYDSRKDIDITISYKDSSGDEEYYTLVFNDEQPYLRAWDY